LLPSLSLRRTRRRECRRPRPRIEEEDEDCKAVFGAPWDFKPDSCCFSRSYDTGHLWRSTPQQNVRTMLLLVKGESDSDGPSYGSCASGVNLRKSGVHFESAGDCATSITDGPDDGGSADVTHCGVDCDGRPHSIVVRDQGRKIGPGLDSRPARASGSRQ